MPNWDARTAYDRAQRRREALQYRLTGASYQEIADQMGSDRKAVSRWVREELANIPKLEADELRQQEVERLDLLTKAVWQHAMAGDPTAIDKALKIIDRRAKLLGLDAPQQVEMSTGDVDLDSTVTKLLKVAELARENETPDDDHDDGEGGDTA